MQSEFNMHEELPKSRNNTHYEKKNTSPHKEMTMVYT